MTDDVPNQKSGIRRRGVAVAGFALLVLAWAGWEQAQLMRRQAAAPVVTVAADGTVRVNGWVLVPRADGLPPDLLTELEGAPPVELLDPETLPGRWPEYRQGIAYFQPNWRLIYVGGGRTRRWLCPRTGLRFESFRNGRCMLYLGGGLLFDPRDSPGTVEVRGQRWWLGRPVPWGGVERRHVLAVERTSDPKSDLKMDEHLALQEGTTEVVPFIHEVYSPWREKVYQWLGRRPAGTNLPVWGVWVCMTPAAMIEREKSMAFRAKLFRVPGVWLGAVSWVR